MTMEWANIIIYTKWQCTGQLGSTKPSGRAGGPGQGGGAMEPAGQGGGPAGGPRAGVGAG